MHVGYSLKLHFFSFVFHFPPHTYTTHSHHARRALGGELFRVIAVDPLPEEKARGVVFQILEGVRHLHTLNIVHMDLKVACNHNVVLYRCSEHEHPS